MISSKYFRCSGTIDYALLCYFREKTQAVEVEVMEHEIRLEDTAGPKGVVRRQKMSPSDTDAN